MFIGALPNTGQDQSNFGVILIIGAVLVALGLVAMIGVRVSRKKNANAQTFQSSKPAQDATTPAAESAAKPAAQSAAKPAAQSAAKPAAKPDTEKK